MTTSRTIHGKMVFDDKTVWKARVARISRFDRPKDIVFGEESAYNTSGSYVSSEF